MSQNSLSARPAFRHGLPMATVEMSVQLQIPSPSETQTIDTLLMQLLDVSDQDFVPLPVHGVYRQECLAASSEPALGYLSRVLAAQSALLRAGNVPIFQAGQVLKLTLHSAVSSPATQSASDPRMSVNCTAIVAVPFVDAMPPMALKRSFEAAEQLLWYLAAHRRMPEMPWIDRVLMDGAIRPIRAVAGAGISTLPILQAAMARHIPLRHLGRGIYQLGQGQASRLLSRSALDTDAALGSEVAARKDHCARLLATAGIPTPVHLLVSNAQAALQAAHRLGYPVVVKPADRERSEGVKVRIQDDAALLKAFETARGLSAHVLVERWIPGVCYRLLIADGRFLYAVERGPRQVLGDGTHTVSELLAQDGQLQRNTPAWARKKVVPLDDETLAVLASQGLTPDAIAARGMAVRLREIESTEWSETTLDVTDRVHPANIELAERAAQVLGLRNAGIDLMTRDIAQPWTSAAGVITEVNFRPHFGGTMAARSRMGAFMERILQGQGRIPIAVFVGDAAARSAAELCCAAWQSRAVTAYLCDGPQVIGPSGPVPFASAEPGLFGLCRTVLMDRRLQALAVVVRDNEFLRTGLPFDQIDRLELLPAAQRLQPDLLAVLQAYVAHPPQTVLAS